MKEKVWEKQIPRKLTAADRATIEQRLGELKKKYGAKMGLDYFWNKAGNKLVVEGHGTRWETVFSSRRVTILLEAPLYLKLLLTPYRRAFEGEIERAMDDLFRAEREA